jgi:hypothetical protein
VSKVVQQANDGTLDLSGAKLVIPEGTEADAANAVGTGSDAIIQVASTSADASISLDVYTDLATAKTDAENGVNTGANTELTDAANDAAGEATSGSPSQTTAIATGTGGVKDLIDKPAVTKVTYTGPDAITDTINQSTKTLVIAGETSGSSGAITVGTLEIAATGKLETSTISATTLTNDGTLTANGTITAPTLTNNKTLTASGTITTTGTLTNTGTLTASASTTAISAGTLINGPIVLDTNEVTIGGLITITASSETAVTVATAVTNDGTIDLGANGTVAGNPSVTNNGTIKTATPTGATLNGILGAKGKIDATGQVVVAANTTLAIPNGTTLTIAGSSGKLTVAAGSPPTTPHGKVTIASGGTLVYDAAATVGELNGELEVASGGTFIDLRSGGGSLWGNSASGTIKWNAGAKGYVGGDAATDLRIGGPNDAATLKLASGGVLKNTKSGYELTGNATVGRYGLDNGLVFTIKENSIFTVDVPASFAPEQGIVITDDGCEIVGTNNTSQIRILPDNAIYFWYDSAKNFYDSNGAQIKSPIPAGNYTWETNAGGATTAGWKASADANTTVDPEQETDDPAKVAAYLAGTVVTEITYTGTAAIPGTTSVAGKTLVIKNTIAEQNAAINVTELIINGTGKLSTTAPIAVSTLTIDGGTLTTSGANGSISTTTLTNSGVLTAAAPINAGSLTIGSGGSLTSTGANAITVTGALNNSGVLTTSGATGPAIVLTGSGQLINSATIDLGDNGTIVKDTGSVANTGTVITNTTTGGTLSAILANVTGSISASGNTISLPTGGTTTVKTGTTLTVGGTLTVPTGANLMLDSSTSNVVVKGTLDLSGLLITTDNDAVTLNGTIEVAENGTLKVPAPESDGTTPQIKYGDDGVTKVNWNGTVNIGGQPYIIKNGETGLYTWTDANDSGSPAIATAEQYVTLKKNNETFLHGNLTTNNSITVNAGQKTTIDTGATLTLGAATSVPTTSRFFIDGEVIVSGTIKVAATDGENTQVGWVELRDDASKLTLLPGGKLDIAAGSSVYTASGTGESTPRVSVYAAPYVSGTSSPTRAKTTGTSDTNFVLVTEPTTGDSASVILGYLQISITDAASPFTGTTAGTPAAGTLTAGGDTAIVFEKEYLKVAS